MRDIAGVTVAEAATIINAIITFLRYSLGLALITLLLYFLSPSNSANSWTVAARQVHTSLWPVILRSTSESHASIQINFFSKLSLISALLVTVCGIVTPLGLKQGPTIRYHHRHVNASFVEDKSPLGLATSPRQEFKHGRICGGMKTVVCPGKTPDTINQTEIPPSILETFSSTPHSPFNMQFRRYFTDRTLDAGFTVSIPLVNTVQSVVLRDGIFAAKGVVIDMSDSPGIGLLNHTIPLLKEGATWSQDILWLEPVTTCVNTNLTAEYVIMHMLTVDQPHLIDHGGFVNLTTEPVTVTLDGQNVNLHEHAYKAAILSNRSAMKGLNIITQNDSYIGKPYPLNTVGFEVGVMSAMGLTYLLNTTMDSLDIPLDKLNLTLDPAVNIPDVTFDDLHTLCRGFGGGDNANITNVSVHCGVFAGPTRRTDGGDEGIPSFNSKWSQTFHACASATRASIQTVTFSVNSSKELSDFQITRTANNTPVLWAVEKSDLNISNIDLFWGRVADQYEFDSSLWPFRSGVLYVPAGAADVWGLAICGQPSTVPAIAWSKVYRNTDRLVKDLDYSGKGNYALLTKWQSLLANNTNPELGHAQIRNLIWTDIVANSLVGMETPSTLFAASLGPSVTYDFRFGIPLLMLFIIWVPSFVASVFVLLLGLLKISHIRNVIDHTAAGRLALGHSALAAADGIPTDFEPIDMNGKDWRKTAGRTTLSLRPIVNEKQRGGEILYDELSKSEV